MSAATSLGAGVVRMPTGSGLGRAIACPASCALPGAGKTTEASTTGNDNHSEMEKAALCHARGEQVALEGARLELFHECVGASTIVGVERTYALDIVKGTARHLGDRLERDYRGATQDEIVLTVDLVVRMVDGWIRVVDWKSRKRVTSSFDNWQMRAALMAATMVEGGKALGEMVLGYLDDGETDRADASSMDLSEWWGELFRFRDIMRGAPQTLIHEGPWCEYCPATNFCPTKTRLALAMVGELDLNAATQEMTNEQAGTAWVKVNQVLDLAERIKEALKDRAKNSPIPLPNGKHLRLVEMPGRNGVDNDAVKKVFEEMGKPLPMKKGKPYTQLKEQK